MNRKVIIIGSGPAGYTAAIYAARAGLKPLMITGMKVGGQLMDTTDVENFPGYKDGVLGPIMMNDLMEQALRFGTEIIYSHVEKVDFSKQPYKVYDDSNKEYTASSIIISTGAEAKLLGNEYEQKFWGRGVSACATCDGFFFKDKNVVVIGGGDTACEEALYLSNICTNVTILVRSDKMRASTIMQERVKAKKNIEVFFSSELSTISGEKKVELIEVKLNNGHKLEIPCSAVFIAIGHKPNTEMFNELITDPEGYLVTKADSTHTNIPGVFACGDVKDKIYRQAITAAGSGCMAALDCERYLNQ
jgi:thioredoxin reductase (NADPH)